LSEAQVEQLDGVNVLLIPVGGGATLTAAMAAETVSLLEPNVVVPMHYQLPGLSRDLAPVSRFLKVLGSGKIAPQEALQVRSGSLPEGSQVVLLEPRATPSELT
jgi:L-ascorbate metabolism protein UlaG (beta-lactamase superfamily)